MSVTEFNLMSMKDELTDLVDKHSEIVQEAVRSLIDEEEKNREFAEKQISMLEEAMMALRQKFNDDYASRTRQLRALLGLPPASFAAKVPPSTLHHTELLTVAEMQTLHEE